MVIVIKYTFVKGLYRGLNEKGWIVQLYVETGEINRKIKSIKAMVGRLRPHTFLLWWVGSGRVSVVGNEGYVPK